MRTPSALVTTLTLVALAPARAQSPHAPPEKQPLHPLLCPESEHVEARAVDGLRRRRDLLLRSRWAELEAELDELRKKGRLEGDVRAAVEEPLEGLTLTSDIAALDSWCRASRRHWAPLVRGMTAIDHAWEARGSGWASTVPEDGSRRMQERLLLARAKLDEAARIDPKDPRAASQLITVAMGTSQPETEARAALARALAADPRYIPAYTAMATYLLPRWHGTPESLFDFVQRSIQARPDEPGLLLVAAYAHEWVDSSQEYMKSPEAQRAVLACYDHVVAAYPRCAEAWRSKGQLAEQRQDAAGRYAAFYQGAECGDVMSMWAAAHHEVFNPQDLPPGRRDVKVGLRHLCRAAHAGSETAMAMLGEAFRRAIPGIPIDGEQSAYWYRWALAFAKSDQDRMQSRFSLMLLIVRGQAAPRDAREVLSLLVPEVEKGQLTSSAWLGRVLVEGRFAPKDVRRGANLLMDAVRKGNAPAKALLGRFLVEGGDIQQDLALGTRLLNEAAAAQEPDADLVLGRLARDPVRGVQHLRRAHAAHHPDAEAALIDLLARHPQLRQEGDPTPR